MNSIGIKISVFLLSLFVIAYVCYQAYTALYRPYQTETVTMGNYVQDVDLDGFFVRDEQILSVKRSGVISYNYKNAQKVPKNSVIANIYEREDDLYNLKRIETLEKQKAILEEAQERESIDGVKLDLLNKQISTSKQELVKYVDGSNFDALDSTVENLMLGINKFNVFVDNELSFQSTIDSITTQIGSLKSSIAPVKGTITSEEAGYFANVVDGLETKLKPAMLDTMTVADVEKVLSNRELVYQDNIGKLERSDRWYFVALMSAKEAELFKSTFENGWKLTLQFNSESTREVTARIERMITEAGNEKAALVFSSTYLDENFATMRFEKPKAVIADYNGIIIPKEAVRIGKEKDEDGNEVNVKGVYVLMGNTVRFKKADVVYEDSYVLISQLNVSSDYVANYDQVIIKGKDLDEYASTAR